MRCAHRFLSLACPILLVAACRDAVEPAAHDAERARADVSAGSLGGAFSFVAFDAPNSILTVARAVNSTGHVAGWFFDPAFMQHGYVLSNGSFTQVDFNNDVSRNTTALGINDFGDVVGGYRGTDAKTHGYILSGGAFTTVDPPGSLRTIARGINAGGDIVGFFRNSTGFHGFLVNKNNLASFTILDFPGATFTLATGINNSGEIVGIHGGINFVDHGFVRSPAGGYTALKDAPGVDTDSWGISNSGLIAGFYDEFGRAALPDGFTLPNGEGFPFPKASLHGFILAGGVLTPVNISGVAGGINTCIFGIRDDGVIVGQFDSTDGRTHGFVGTPK